jgi:uncharacterized membrane protein YcgQ (UPF0703/DUF1980 family)
MDYIYIWIIYIYMYGSYIYIFTTYIYIYIHINTSNQRCTHSVSFGLQNLHRLRQSFLQALTNGDYEKPGNYEVLIINNGDLWVSNYNNF